jgi:hypothetical protein
MSQLGVAWQDKSEPLLTQRRKGKRKDEKKDFSGFYFSGFFFPGFSWCPLR